MKVLEFSGILVRASKPGEKRAETVQSKYSVPVANSCERAFLEASKFEGFMITKLAIVHVVKSISGFFHFDFDS
jgi:hypothetical protein